MPNIPTQVVPPPGPVPSQPGQCAIQDSSSLILCQKIFKVLTWQSPSYIVSENMQSLCSKDHDLDPAGIFGTVVDEQTVNCLLGEDAIDDTKCLTFLCMKSPNNCHP